MSAASTLARQVRAMIADTARRDAERARMVAYVNSVCGWSEPRHHVEPLNAEAEELRAFDRITSRA